MRGVEAPADPRLGDPLLDARDVVVVEAEAAAHGAAAGEVDDLGRGQAAVGEDEQLGDDAEDRVGLSQRAVGEAHAQVGRPADVVVTRRLAERLGAERGVDQRGERLDVRAHDDDVARLERGVVGEEVEEGVAQHLDLTRPAVARVHLHAAVGRVEEQPAVGGIGERRAGRQAVGADVVLQATQQRRGVAVDRVVDLGVGLRCDDELELAGVATPRGEQRVLGEGGGEVVAAPWQGLAGRRAEAARRRAATARARGGAGRG